METPAGVAALHIPDDIILSRELVSRHMRGTTKALPGTVEILPYDGLRQRATIRFTFDNGRAMYMYRRDVDPGEVYVPHGWQDGAWFHLVSWEATP